MTRPDLADALDEPEAKVLVAKALLHGIAQRHDPAIDVEMAWIMVAPTTHLEFIAKVDHVIDVLRAPEPASKRKRLRS